MATGNHTNQSLKMSQIFKMSQTLCSNGGGRACRDSIKGKLGRINQRSILGIKANLKISKYRRKNKIPEP